MAINDPIMDVADRLPATSSADATSELAGRQEGPVPFGLRFAVVPVIPSDKHKKTYYTVTVKEATQIYDDGKVVTIQDDVQRERED